MALSPQVPLLEAGDIIIDGGNSEYHDTTVAHGETPCAGLSVATEDISHCVFPFPFRQRRCKSLKEQGLLFVGSGVSGGEDGARYGPSLMPGGNKEAW